MENNKEIKDKKYEDLMEELTAIVAKMENPSTTLDEQLTSYEKGIEISNRLFEMLKSFEDRIMIINKDGKEEKFE